MGEPIVLRCKPPCGAPIVRALHTLGEDWVHADDEVVIQGLKVVSTSRYNHPADPDVIDVEPVEDTPPTPTAAPPVAPWRFPPRR